MIPRIEQAKVSIELSRIRRTLSSSELSFCKAAGMSFEAANEGFFTGAPNRGAYQRTNLESFNAFLSKMPAYFLSQSRRFIDLGCGFGGPAFVANLYFRKVEGVEFTPQIVQVALENRRELGGFYRTVRFTEQDFLGLDLRNYDVIFMFRPFCDNFHELAEALLAKTRRDTRVIFHGLEHNEHLDHIFGRNFELKVRGDDENYRFWLYSRR